ncbi:YpsA SLOG family protein [Actinomyces vulturis]|uniref:YpsA SLOG family protein n=1 Tax=Actinomyces vulturis TaxID=1857645 RepID=UPI000829EA6F|nr:putative molybdenum carrier protein [Actinomyces vulturis]
MFAAIRSGGQSGVDRAALDCAIKHGIAVCGFTPAGGWAEDIDDLTKHYPTLTKTPSSDPNVRTTLNVVYSDFTLIISDNDSPGTLLTAQLCQLLDKPCLIVPSDVDRSVIVTWLRSLKTPMDLNVAGDRQSESPGIYGRTKDLLDQVFTTISES